MFLCFSYLVHYRVFSTADLLYRPIISLVFLLLIFISNFSSLLSVSFFAWSAFCRSVFSFQISFFWCIRSFKRCFFWFFLFCLFLFFVSALAVSSKVWLLFFCNFFELFYFHFKVVVFFNLEVFIFWAY